MSIFHASSILTKAAVFCCFGVQGIIRKAILDVFPEDVDFVNSWFTVTSSLVGCLPLLGTWDRRRRSISHFTKVMAPMEAVEAAEKTATMEIDGSRRMMCLL